MKYHNFYFVNVKGYNNIIGVITENYYKKFIYNSNKLPHYYKLFEYKDVSSPFSFTSLNQHLPFTNENTGLKLNSNVFGIEQNALTFHLNIISIFKLYNLDTDIFWFDYIHKVEELWDIHATFTKEYRQFLQNNI